MQKIFLSSLFLGFAFITASVFNTSAHAALSEQEFNQTLDRFEALYTPILSRSGLQLKIVRDWKSPVLNASGGITGKSVVIYAFGGLARVADMNLEMFHLVYCHEFGHAIGGEPLIPHETGDTRVASTGGQADYYAASVCMKLLLQGQDNVEFVKHITLSPVVKNICGKSAASLKLAARCARILTAAEQTGAYLAKFAGTAPVSFVTPDKTVTIATQYQNHPNTQCRLDTFLAGTLCAYEPAGVNTSDIALAHGRCEQPRGAASRPLCWFKP